MSSKRPLPRGRFIPAIFAIADIALVNLLFAFVCAMFPTFAANGARELGVIVNLSLVPEPVSYTHLTLPTIA